MDDADPSLL